MVAWSSGNCSLSAWRWTHHWTWHPSSPSHSGPNASYRKTFSPSPSSLWGGSFWQCSTRESPAWCPGWCRQRCATASQFVLQCLLCSNGMSSEVTAEPVLLSSRGDPGVARPLLGQRWRLVDGQRGSCWQQSPSAQSSHFSVASRLSPLGWHIFKTVCTVWTEYVGRKGRLS